MASFFNMAAITAASVLLCLLAAAPQTSANSSDPSSTIVKRHDGSAELFNFHNIGQGFGDVLRTPSKPTSTGEQHVHYHEPSAPRALSSDGIPDDPSQLLAGISSDSSSGPNKFGGLGSSPQPSPPPSYFRRPPSRRPPFVFPQLGANEEATGPRPPLHSGEHDGPKSTSGFLSNKHPFFSFDSTATPTPNEAFPALFGTPSSLENSGEFGKFSAPRKVRTKSKRPSRRPAAASHEFLSHGLPSYPPSTPNPNVFYPLRQPVAHPGSGPQASYPSHPFLQDPWSPGSTGDVEGNDQSAEDYPFPDSQGYTIACTDYRGRSGQCVPPVKCARFSQQIGGSKGDHGPSFGSGCEYHHGEMGVCCPVEYEQDRGRAALLPLLNPDENPAPRLTKYDVDEACYAGITVSDSWVKIEDQLRTSDRVLRPGAAAYYHHGLVRVMTDMAVNTSRTAIASIGASNHLIRRYQLNPIEAGFQLKSIRLDETALADRCPAPPRCLRDSQFYRTVDGTCNNLQNPSWGQSRSGMTRYLPPTYEDGIFAPRRLSVTGEPLPSTRLISAMIVGDVDRPHPIFTNLVSDWGQFIDHDIAHLGMFKLDARNNTAIQCCRDGARIEPPPHPACLPIDLPEDDPFYSKFGQTCMEFVRSLPAFDCRLGFIDQMDQVTHFIDASTLYGSEDDVAQNVRFFNNGQLRTLTTVVDRPLLALQDVDGDGCSNVTVNRRCFLAGDDRVNQNVMLVLHHTAFTREHNRIAAELQTLNPRWNDELLFQEARRIVIAMIQHISYNEWLRLLLGERLMAAYRLNPQEEGFSKDYDPDVNPTIVNEFATAGYRLHTLPTGTLRMRELGQKKFSGPGMLLRDLFFDPVIAFSQTESDSFIRGVSSQPVQQFDNLMSIELTQHLFEGQNPFGLDLASINMQRGRDHGLPTYNTMRVACGLPRARSFEDLADVIPPKVLSKFQQVYAHVDDIDLFVAGISERPLDHDAFIGPTFACIVADQFARLKRGDRFFYEFSGHSAAFTKAQLREIRKSSLARVFCDNTDVGEMQPLVFIQPSPLNRRVNCNSTAIPRMNLRLWKDTRFNNEPVGDSSPEDNYVKRRSPHSRRSGRF